METDKSDEEYEEEECLIYLDFQTKIKSETLDQPNVQIKMIGFDTDEPIVQVNNKIFRGKISPPHTLHTALDPHFPTGSFDHAMGTNVFFSTDPNPPAMDPNFETVPSTMYEWHSQTNKVLKMERIFITPKQDNEEEAADGMESPNEDDVVPNESYSEALNHFLNHGEEPPRTLSGSDVIKPVEFQTFFRPKLNAADGESEENQEGRAVNESVEDDENNERNNETSVSEEAEVGDESEPSTSSPMKIDSIKQENQWQRLKLVNL